MGITFTKFNETLNYCSKTSRTTGENVWNQDEIQRAFIKLIEPCTLTKEQLNAIDSFMVYNNITIGGQKTENPSVKEFREFMAKSEQVSIRR
ncbi:MAG: hypothetical protein E7165_01970 [Firmicutes bacterium]|nr:hypothetical protein [Bacillota bacterium]